MGFPHTAGTDTDLWHKIVVIGKVQKSLVEGDVLEVIPEERDEEHYYIGYSDNYLKVRFVGNDDLIGQIVKVKVTKAGYPINDGEFVRVVTGETEHVN